MKKKSETIYPIGILLFGLWVYFWMIFSTTIVTFDATISSFIYLGFIHLTIFLFTWSMVATMATDPGVPPVFWV